MELKVRRVEVIDSTGRKLVKRGDFTLSFQDNGLTLKIFALCGWLGCREPRDMDEEYCKEHSND